MVYKEDYLCSPFVMCQVGMMQNEFLLLPNYLEQGKDSFSKMVYSEIEKVGIIDSFFRVTSYKSYIVIVHYWATTHKEPESGRSGLFTICGIITSATALKKKFNDVCKLSCSFFQIIDALNSTTENTIHTSENEAVYYFEKSSNSDIVWEKIQNNEEALSETIFREYDEAYKSNSQDQNVTKKNRFKSKQLFSIDIYNDKNTMNLILLDENSNQNRIRAFLHESYLLKKRHKRIDVATIRGVFPFSICFLHSQEDITAQLLFEVSRIIKYKCNNLKYIKLSKRITCN